MATGVMTATGALITLVASQRPPMPTSTTATSTGASANAANAIAVRTSNLLIAGPPAACDCASIICTNGSISRYVATYRAGLIGVPSIAMRSTADCKCGLVVRPVRRCSAVSSASIIRTTEVLPLVPATWIDG